MHKCVGTLAEALPGAAALALDASIAFNTLPRQTALDAVARRAPRLLPTANAWLTRPTTHLFWNSHGAAMPVAAKTGVDQGCPLSPALFAIGIADALGQANARLLQLHASARLSSYLDVVVVVPAHLADQAHDVVCEEMARAGLTLNRDKTKAWTPSRATALPNRLEHLRADSLTVLGNTVAWYDRDEGDDDARLPLLGGSDGREVLSKTQHFLDHWRTLRKEGLSAESAHTLLHTYAQGCCTHLLRANYETAGTAPLDTLPFGASE